jgi:glycosyltransferase involved in cell wall biosynthesis
VVARDVERLGLGVVVDYLGPVEGEAKAALYRQADLFVLPTFSENFGLVVAEALAYGVPVITTRGAPWADLETGGLNWAARPSRATPWGSLVGLLNGRARSPGVLG